MKTIRNLLFPVDSTSSEHVVYLKPGMMAIGVLVSLPMPCSVYAQGLIEEVTVTAQRREQSLQDVGIAVTAFTGEQMESLAFENTTDIARFTPNVSMSGAGAGQLQQFSIRGVTQNDFSDHVEAPNAVYIDEAYVASGQGQIFALYDLERVEVLKGPQGTLFGRNATGGAISFITRKPTDEWDGLLNLRYGSYNQIRAEGAYGGPISDNVRFRVSGLYNAHDEIYDNEAPGDKDDVWNDDTLSARLHLDFDLSDRLGLLLSAFTASTEYSTSPYQSKPTAAVFDSQGRQVNSINLPLTDSRSAIGPGTEPVSPSSNPVDGLLPGFLRPVAGADFLGYRDSDGSDENIFHEFADDSGNQVDADGFTARFDLQLEGSEIVAIADTRTTERESSLDCDAGPLVLNCFNFGKVENSSLELRWVGGRERLSWQVGAYYLNIDADVPAQGLAVPGASLTDQAQLETDSYSVFGQVDYRLSDTLTLVGGLRLIKEDKDFSYRSDVRLSDDAATEFLGPILVEARAFEDDLSQDLWSGKLQLEWTPSDDLLVYGGINRGVKAGSFNAPFAGGEVVRDADIPYDEEVLYAYEVGFKKSALDGKLRINGAAFYYDYEDYQSYVFFGVTTRVSNNDASYSGVELELTAEPVQGLTLLASASYIDAEIEDIDLYTILTDVRPAFTPEWQFNGLARYQFPLFDGYGFVQGDFNWTSSYYYQLSNFDSVETDGVELFNAALGYETDAWTAFLSVQNLLDERYETFGFDFSTFSGGNEVAYARPRWVSLSVNFNF